MAKSIFQIFGNLETWTKGVFTILWIVVFHTYKFLENNLVIVNFFLIQSNLKIVSCSLSNALNENKKIRLKI